MTTLKLNLKENMLDSFTEGMTKLRLAESTMDDRAYKFCVVHLFHFFELNLKYHVWLKDKNAVFSGNRGKTISADKALNYLELNDCKFRRYLKEDFIWLKDLRNNIMHYEVSIDIPHWRFRIPRILFLIELFNKSCDGLNFEREFSEIDWKDYSALIAQHFKKFDAAVNSIIHEYEQSDSKQNPRLLYRCKNCDNHTATHSESKKLYTCHFCGSNRVVPHSDKHADEYFCIIQIPKRYKTETTRVESKPVEHREIKTESGMKTIAIPAQYKFVTKRKLVAAARYIAKYAEPVHNTSRKPSDNK